MRLHLCIAQVLLKEVLERCSNVCDHVYVLMHDIVVLSTCFNEMLGMNLYDEVSSYVLNVSIGDYMMKVLLDMNEVLILTMLFYEVNY